MQTNNPIDLLFKGMEKLGPGDNSETIHILSFLPKDQAFDCIVDAGCGTGRQTLALAKELNALIHAVDIHQPFLESLTRQAEAEGIAHYIKPLCMDMKDIPFAFDTVDLLWSEGAAYNIGFANALNIWAAVLKTNGFAVISELSWLREDIPESVKTFFNNVYPDMQSVSQNIVTAKDAGYSLLATHTISQTAWVEGYYDVLAPRANVLMKHPDPFVRELATATLQEIDIFQDSEDSYGYVFYVLQCI